MVSNAKQLSTRQRVRANLGLDFKRGRLATDATGPFVAGRPGYARVEEQKGPNEFLPAVELLNRTTAQDPGTYVLLGKFQGKLAIVGIDEEAEIGRGSDPGVSKKNKQLDYVTKGILTEFIPFPLGSTEIAVGPGFLPNGDYFPGAATTTLTAAIAGLSSGEQQLAVVYVTRAGALEVTFSTAQSALDPLGADDLLECHAAASPGVLPIIGVQLTAGQTNIQQDSFKFDIRLLFSAFPAHSTANVSATPTDAELDSAFGTPADVGAGFIGTLDDNGAGTLGWIVWSDGTNWLFSAGTIAT